ncbi:MAG: septum formation initiator family protein [Desulfobacteraceae bacterium]|nr:septum formation initiator family protein [Desulfobacteraceae bacterium]MDD3991103.1 septum formation initiator family protein [Desulfobacteraceae bacterium]
MTKYHKIMMAAVLLGLIHFALVIVFGDKGLAELYRQRTAHQRQLADNDRLERHNLVLFGKIQRLRSDPAYIEAVARQQLLVRPEEIVISLPAPAPEP